MNGNGSKTILLVESSDLISMAEEMTLKEYGYKVIIVNTGEKAVEIIDKSPDIDLILMAIDLGTGIDGTQAARQILRKRDIPIIFLTSHSEKEYVDKVKEITHYGYVLKNSEGFVLQSSIEMAFELFFSYEKIAKSEKRLEDIIFSTNDWVWEVNEKGVYTYISQKGCEFLEYPSEKFLGKTPFDFMQPEEAKRVGEIFLKLAANKAPIKDLENWNIRNNGERICLLSNALPMLDKNGNLKGYRGVDKDITEHKRAERHRGMVRKILQILNEQEDLQNSIQRVVAELKARTSFDAVGIRLQDGDDFPYLAQQGFSEDFLATENTLIGHTVDGEVCRDKDGNVNLECACGLVISGKTNSAYPFLTREGSFWTNDSFSLLDLPSNQDPRFHLRNECIHQKYASVALIPIRNKDRVVGLIQLNDRCKGSFTLDSIESLEGIASHIGEALMRRSVEEKLLNAAQEWRKTFDSITDFIFVRDNNCNIKRSNKAFAGLFKMSPKEIIGKKTYELFHKTFDSSYTSAVEEVKKNTTPITIELEEINLEIFLEITISPVYDKNGNNTSTVSYLKNITRRKKAEEEIIKYRDHLEEIVKERTTELEISRNEAQEANLAKSKFIATMNHELRTPLNSIIGFSKLLHKGFFGSINDKQKEALSDILSSSRHLLNLINDILDIAKVEAKKMELHISNVNVSDLIRNNTFIIKEQCMQMKLKLCFEVDRILPGIQADEQKLKQSLYNLISNAVKFTPEGGEITIGAYPEDKSMVIFVRDTGIGIEEKDRDKIFSSFQQIDSALSRKYEGTGLGLALSKSFIELHGGRMWFESKGKDKGSTFFMSIPMTREDAGNKIQETTLLDHEDHI